MKNANKSSKRQQKQQQLDSLRWFSQRRSPTPHFAGCAPRAGYDPQIRTRPRFLYNAPTIPKIHHPMFACSELSCWQTNKQTNKQTPLKTSNALRYATALGNQNNVITSPQVSRQQIESAEHDLLGDVPDVTGGVETHQLIADRYLVKCCSLLVTEERVRNPDILKIVLAKAHLHNK